MGSPAISPQLGHLDVALSQFAVGYRNNALISDLVAPRVPVGRQSDKYTIFDREGQIQAEKTLRAPATGAQRIRMTESKDKYFADCHALGFDLASETENIDQRRQRLTQVTMDKILLGKEIDCASMLTDTTKVTNNVTLAGGDQWSDPANSDPIGTVETAKSKVRLAGVEANWLVIGDPTYQALIKHPQIVERLKYTQAGAVKLQDLAAVFNIENLVVARAVQVVAGTPQFVWGKDVLVLYASPNPGMDDISLAKTFVWQNAPAAVGGMGVVTGPHPDPTAMAESTGVNFYYDQKVIVADGGYLIKAAVA